MQPSTVIGRNRLAVSTNHWRQKPLNESPPDMEPDRQPDSREMPSTGRRMESERGQKIEKSKGNNFAKKSKAEKPETEETGNTRHQKRRPQRQLVPNSTGNQFQLMLEQLRWMQRVEAILIDDRHPPPPPPLRIKETQEEEEEEGDENWSYNAPANKQKQTP